MPATSLDFLAPVPIALASGGRARFRLAIERHGEASDLVLTSRPELAAAECDQVSIETAQSGLDCSVLAELSGKTVILGVLNLGDHTVESADEVAARVRRALPYVPAERLVLAPDCGMKYLPRDVAFGKLTAMTEAAARLRAELG